MSRESLEQFQRTFMQNTILQEQVKATVDKESFVSLLINLGEEAGYSFTAEEVEYFIQEQDPNFQTDLPTSKNLIKGFKVAEETSEPRGATGW